MADTDPHEPRPLVHFTPPFGWLNDPNGLVFDQGVYHLFYQYHPESLLWGPMHWGHATSSDLTHWQHQPIALAPDEHGTIFSGSAVIDTANTAGFGHGALVTIFTHNGHHVQHQSLGFSTDGGQHVQKYPRNPVLPGPPGHPDFRDPKVFWYGGESDGFWVMVLAVGQEIWFYRSPDLKTWQQSSIFGQGYGSHGGVWETPDLFELEEASSGERRWVLIVAVGDGAPAGGNGTQYFLGGFDGMTFTPAESPERIRWADWGSDFYAPQSWSGVADGRRLWLAWMNNWMYGRDVPAITWRGMMTLPREVRLARSGDDLVLAQRPVAELAERYGEALRWENLRVLPGENPLEHCAAAACVVQARFLLEAGSSVGLRVRVGPGEATTIGYDSAAQELYVERTAPEGLEKFAGRQRTQLAPVDGALDLLVVVDHTSVEVFANDGLLVLSCQIFPQPGSQGLALFSENGPVAVSELVFTPLV